MGTSHGKSGQYPTGNLGIEGTGNLGKGDGKTGHRNDLEALISKRMYLQGNDHSTFTTPDGGRKRLELFEIRSGRSIPVIRPQRRPRAHRRLRGWPDLSPFDLWNSIDLANAHELLVATGFASEGYDGLRRIVLAAVMARRLAQRRPYGYFATIVLQGFTHFGPADRDHDEAKAILREIFAI
jgi:hypothetical protein